MHELGDFALHWTVTEHGQGKGRLGHEDIARHEFEGLASGKYRVWIGEVGGYGKADWQEIEVKSGEVSVLRVELTRSSK